MGREDKTPSPDEEYMPEFTGEHSGEPFSAEQSTGPQFSQEEVESMRPGMHPAVRKILIMVGLMLAIVAVMWFLRHQEKVRNAAQGAEPNQTTEQQAAQTPTKEKSPLSANTPATPAPAPIAAPVPAAAQPVVQPAAPVAAAPSNPALNATNVQAIQSMDQETSSKITELSTQVRTLADSMSRVSQSVQTLETKVAGMSKAPLQAQLEKAPVKTVEKEEVVIKTTQKTPVVVTTHSDTVVKHHKHPRAKHGHIRRTTVYSQGIEIPVETPYVVKAMIPRRAWIDGPYNSSFTVTVGDVIPGLGKVMQINVRAGEVVTSGGIIEFSDE